MKIAFITIGFVLLIIGIVIAVAMIKDHLDTKARKAEYQKMLDRQKRQAAYDNDPAVKRFRESYKKSQQVLSRYPKSSGSKPAPRRVKARESGDYVIADTGDTFDGYWIDDSNDRVSGWTSTTDNYSSSDTSTSWGSSDSSYNNSSDSGSSSGSSYSSDSGSSSSSYDSGSSSSSSSFD